MRVPLTWLAVHVDLGDVTPERLADQLTFAGLEIERIDWVGQDVSGVLTARVLEVKPHPDADRLALVTIDAGGEPREVVCGAHNYAVGDVVPWAAPGAKLPGGLEIGRRKVRGRWSDGMLASARELGVYDDHAGILILPPDTPVGADLTGEVGLRDAVFDIKTFPNRGDTLSIRGVAREAALVLGAELRPLDLTVPEAGPPAATLASVEVEDTEGCPLYYARVIEGVDAARPAPLWMARRLYLYGQRPLGAVVDVTNYLLIDQGQPLHAFDLDRIPGHRVLVRRARPGELLRTLDGRDRHLTPDDTLITAGAEPLALAGIMGGEDSEVRPDSTRILLEAAHFPPKFVRRTTRRLGMSTEGAQRWARGVDPAGAGPVGDQAARLIAELAGGTVAAGRLQAGPGVPPREAIRLNWRRSARRLGAPADPAFAAAYLESVGCQVRVEGGPDAIIAAVPPSWRFDLEGWADLEEEVARRWGYHQLPATLPKATGGRLTAEQRLRRRTRELLAGMGLTEVQTYPFTSQAALDRLELPRDDRRRAALRVANPISEEAPELRTTLLPGLAEVARRGLEKGLTGVAVYEIGAVFLPDPDRGAETAPGGGAAGPATVGEGLPAEPRMLGILLAGRRPAGRFDDPASELSFFDAKGVIEGLAAALGVDQLSYRAESPPPYHPGRCAGIWLDTAAPAVGQERVPIGVVGQLHPRVARNLELPAATFAAELELTPLLAAAPATRPAPVPSPYPELSFDVAFLVPPGVAAADLRATLSEAAAELLARLTLFDAYQGPPLPPGYRNLAYRVALQAPDRTLTDADAAAVRDRMVALARDRHGADLRAE
jgi:phenylalanyl-tRNA synthetase beta chain